MIDISLLRMGLWGQCGKGLSIITVSEISGLNQIVYINQVYTCDNIQWITKFSQVEYVYEEDANMSLH